jgi:predicted house-cleaning noncanonical NTP pyrophosphatase (MazG superfamily)
MRYNKLVRDGIPQKIETAGQTYTAHIADANEFREKLLAKLVEEAQEIQAKPSAEELADLWEVIMAIAEEFKIDLAEVEAARKRKFEKYGGFSQRIILEES